MKKSTLIYLFINLLLISSFINAQSVSTFATTPLAFGDGMTVSDEGELYIAGGYNKNKIIKISTSGIVSDFVSNLPGPVGPGFDSEGNMYVTNYTGNSISKIAPDLSVTTFSSGLDGPAGLYINENDEIFVSLYGTNFSGRGNKIIKYTNGVGSTFALNNGLQDAIGLTFDEEGNAYFTNFLGGNVYKINTSGEVSKLTTISGAQINQIAYAKGYVYIPCPNLRKVYRVSKEGVLEHFAGNGQKGTDDGPLLSAKFDFPNSVAVSPTGDTLYISDQKVGKVRLIDLSNVTNVENENKVPDGFSLEQNYPNPFNPTTTIQYTIANLGGLANVSLRNVQLKVYDILGSEVATLVNEVKSPGSYEVKFDASQFKSGVYFYRLSAGDFTEIKRMLLMK